jgi:hypothetical protein
VRTCQASAEARRGLRALSRHKIERERERERERQRERERARERERERESAYIISGTMGGSYSSPAQKISKHYASFENSLPTMKDKVVLVTGCTTGTGYTREKNQICGLHCTFIAFDI